MKIDQKKNTEKIFLFFFIFILVYYILQLGRLYKTNDELTTSWWLINYYGGFVKRGFLGTTLILISELLKIKILNILFFFQIFIFALYIYLLFKNLLEKNIFNYWLLVIFFSPNIILIYFYETFYIARHEIILFIIYLLYVNLLQNKISNLKLKLFFLSIFLSFIILSHEILIFYLIYFFTPHFLFKKKNFNVITCLIFLILPIISAAVLFFYGTKFNSIDICQKIYSVGVYNCNTILNFNQLGIKDYFFLTKEYALNNKYFYTYSLAFILSIIPFYYFFNNSKYLIKFINLFILNFLYSIPIFFLAYDWGRYFQIHLVLWFIIMIKLLPSNNIKFLVKNKFSFLIYFLTFLYLISWSMPACCQGHISGGLINKLFKIYEKIYLF